jgi:hypothetical protein
MALMTLHQYLAREERENSVPHELTTLLLSVADAAKNIRGKVSQRLPAFWVWPERKTFRVRTRKNST